MQKLSPAISLQVSVFGHHADDAALRCLLLQPQQKPVEYVAIWK